MSNDTLSKRHGYIVVEGPIGVGKTSLAKRLAETLHGTAVLENAEVNPFLERFYHNPRQAALPTQLHFLFQRARQLEELRQADLFKPLRVADFCMDKDRLFAQLTLDDEELRLYDQVRARMNLDLPPPDLVIYLQAPLETLLTRIGRRGVAYERLIESSYLQRLASAYTDFFYHYDQAPLLIVNAAEIDPINNERDYQLLLEQVRKIKSGRHYFNPRTLRLHSSLAV